VRGAIHPDADIDYDDIVDLPAGHPGARARSDAGSSQEFTRGSAERIDDSRSTVRGRFPDE
jgi:hypothetical protein